MRMWEAKWRKGERDGGRDRKRHRDRKREREMEGARLSQRLVGIRLAKPFMARTVPPGKESEGGRGCITSTGSHGTSLPLHHTRSAGTGSLSRDEGSKSTTHPLLSKRGARTSRALRDVGARITRLLFFPDSRTGILSPAAHRTARGGR